MQFVEIMKVDLFPSPSLGETLASSGQLDLIKLLHEKAPKPNAWFSPDTMDCAAANGHLEVVKWLHFNRSEGCSPYAINGAARNGYFEIVKFLQENRQEGCTSDAIDDALSRGHVDIVRFLGEHYKDLLCPEEFICTVISRNDIEMAQWMMKTFQTQLTKSSLEHAALHGKMETINFVLLNISSKIIHFSIYVMYVIAKKGKIELLQLLLVRHADRSHQDITHMKKLVKVAFNGAVIEGHMPIFKWILTKWDLAAVIGPLTAVESDDGHETIEENERYTFHLACKARQIQVLRFLYTHYAKYLFQYTNDIFDKICAYCPLEMTKWIYEMHQTANYTLELSTLLPLFATRENPTDFTTVEWLLRDKIAGTKFELGLDLIFGDKQYSFESWLPAYIDVFIIHCPLECVQDECWRLWEWLAKNRHFHLLDRIIEFKPTILNDPVIVNVLLEQWTPPSLTGVEKLHCALMQRILDYKYHQHGDNKKKWVAFVNKILAWAVSINFVSLLGAMLASGYMSSISSWHQSAVWYGTKNDNVEVLEWVQKFVDAPKLEKKRDRFTSEAISGGYFEVLQWLYKQNLLAINARSMDIAASCGHSNILIWLASLEPTVRCSDHGLRMALDFGDVDCIQFLIDQNHFPT